MELDRGMDAPQMLNWLDWELRDAPSNPEQIMHLTVAPISAELARNYLDLLLAGDRLACRELIDNSVNQGVAPYDLLVSLVYPTMELMQSHNCRHLPVMRDDAVVAFLSMRDLMNYELARKTEELAHMRTYIAGS